MSFRRSAASEISFMPVRESLSSVSVASVLNSNVAVGSELLLGPFPVVPSASSFHMDSVRVNIGLSISVSGSLKLR